MHGYVRVVRSRLGRWQRNPVIEGWSGRQPGRLSGREQRRTYPAASSLVIFALGEHRHTAHVQREREREGHAFRIPISRHPSHTTHVLRRAGAGNVFVVNIAGEAARRRDKRRRQCRSHRQTEHQPMDLANFGFATHFEGLAAS